MKLKQLTTESASLGMIIGSCLTTIMILWHFTSTYAVNVFFWDEWDFYQALFQHHSWWDVFAWQHGSHRQGISFLIRCLFDKGWDSRLESFSTATYLTAAMTVAVFLKKKAIAAFASTDLLIPFIVLTLTQMETVVVVGSATPSACPLFLFCLYAFAWTMERSVLKYTTLSVLQFLLVFTGYGYTSIPVCLIVLLSDIKRNKGGMGLFALSSLTATIALFLRGYWFQPFTFDVQRNVHPLFDYVLFAAQMQSGFFGLESTSLETIVGVVSLTVLIGVFLWNLNQLEIKFSNAAIVKVLLSGLTLTYSICASAGRVEIGYAPSSRYMTLLIPGILAVLFQISTFPRILRLTFASLLLSLVAHGYFMQLTQTESRPWRGLVRVKQDWKDCFLKTSNARFCTEKVGLGVYPDTQMIQSRLEFLKANHLNLFKGKP